MFPVCHCSFSGMSNFQLHCIDCLQYIQVLLKQLPRSSSHGGSRTLPFFPCTYLGYKPSRARNASPYLCVQSPAQQSAGPGCDLQRLQMISGDDNDTVCSSVMSKMIRFLNSLFCMLKRLCPD